MKRSVSRGSSSTLVKESGKGLVPEQYPPADGLVEGCSQTRFPVTSLAATRPLRMTGTSLPWRGVPSSRRGAAPLRQGLWMAKQHSLEMEAGVGWTIQLHKGAVRLLRKAGAFRSQVAPEL